MRYVDALNESKRVLLSPDRTSALKRIKQRSGDAIYGERLPSNYR
jgi:hypothetical protein